MHDVQSHVFMKMQLCGETVDLSGNSNFLVIYAELVHRSCHKQLSDIEMLSQGGLSQNMGQSLQVDVSDQHFDRGLLDTS